MDYIDKYVMVYAYVPEHFLSCNEELLDIIPSTEEKIFDMLIRKETKKELDKSFNKLSNEDNFIICSLYSIKTKK